MRLQRVIQHRQILGFAFILAFFVVPLDLRAALLGKNKVVATSRHKDYEQDIRPLLGKYCYGCHGETKKKADLSLQLFETKASVLNDLSTWEKVLHHVQTREMPPENKPQPSDEERTLITRWIESDVFNCDCDHPDPGRVTLHRLNRAEYNNTIRDLLGAGFRAADDFPADDSGYGFDNIGDVLSLSPILLEKYMATAEKILNTAIVIEFSTSGPAKRFEAEKLASTAPGGLFQNRAFRLSREGEIYTPFTFAQPGDYILRAKAFGEQAGTEPARMEFRIDGAVMKTFDVTAVQNAPQVYELHFKIGAGPKKISAGYINNYVNQDDPDPDNRDRNLIIDYLEIVGPAAPQALPESHKRIFPRPVPVLAEAKKNYARQILNNFAKRAYRRPLTTGELDRLVAFMEMAQSEGDNFQKGIKLALQAVLVSPHFLFRGEIQPDPNNAKSIHSIDEFALASRLSYFLWSSMPDDELFRLAEQGKLRKNLEPQVRRMLRDKKTAAFVENFAGQWLQIRNLNLVMPDLEKFPEFDEPLRIAMRKETELFFESLLKENRSIFDLLAANYTFVNERLAKHYGIPKISGEQFRRVSLNKYPATAGRSGILTHASILTLTSNPTRTSPVKRGKWVLENILGAPPPPPPANVPDLKEGKATALTGTLRQRLEQHRADPNCASCHARMDPIGFAFENFDGVGGWRKKDGDLPIDASGELVSGESFRDASELRKILVSQKKEEFVRCLSEKLLTYALGRGMEMYDRCAIEQIAKNLTKKNYKFDELIMEIAKSVPFQMRRGEEHLAQNSR
ncbi:MAG: DUF1592 domain-containing protein [Verrucomicrobiota bacterium]